jgi:hypothetical protein
MAGVPGSYVFADWVAPECLRLLTNMLALTGYANWDYEKEFDREFQVGETVRVKYPQLFTVSDGQTYNPQAINRINTTITLDQWMQIGFEWDSLERALKLERSEEEIRKQYLVPAMRKLAQEAESRFSLFVFQNTNNIVGALGTTPTSMQTFSAATTRLWENAGLDASEKYGMFLTPQMQENAIAASIAYFHPGDELSRAWKRGYIGQYANADWYTSMSLRSFTTGVFQTQASITVNGAGQSGSTLNINCVTGDTFKVGDRFNIASVNNVNPMTLLSTNRLKQFVITQATTGASSTATLNIYPSIIGPGSPYQNVDALPTNTALLTMWPGTTISNGTAKSGVLGVALNDQAFFMAGGKIANPKESSVEIASQMQDKETGISLAFVRAFDPVERRWINRFDSLIGFGNAYGDRCACLIGSNQ